MMKVRYYKCPECGKKFKTLTGWGDHVKLMHSASWPEGYSVSRFFYYTVTGKTHGICRTCKGDTEWNEGSMKYDQYCKNPECKKAYVKIAKSRMIGKYGKVHILDDPDQQRKMIANRKISGTYRFHDGTVFSYVGSYERNFLKMLNELLFWSSHDIISPSPHTYYYDYENPKDSPKNQGKKFYIPDFYIPSLNLEIEIKQQTSTNKAFNEINRVKEKLKDEVMASNRQVKYMKINDNDFTEFFKLLMEFKERDPSQDDKESDIMDVMESYTGEDIRNREEMEPATEKLLSNVPDIYYNKEAFDLGKINLCFITGHSGSGKTTMATSMVSLPNIEVIEMDDAITNWHFSDIDLTQYGELISSFFRKVGSQYRYHTEEAWNLDDQWDNREFLRCYEACLTRDLVAYAIEFASKHPQRKFVLEGVWLYFFLDPIDFRNYAVYIKGTSAVESSLRGMKRDVNTNHLIRRFLKRVRRFGSGIRETFKYEKRLNNWRSYFSSIANESHTPEIAMESSNMADDKVLKAIGNYFSNQNVKFKPGKGGKWGLKSFLEGKSDSLFLIGHPDYKRFAKDLRKIVGPGYHVTEDNYNTLFLKRKKVKS